MPRSLKDFLQGSGERDALQKGIVDLGLAVDLPPYLPNMSGGGRKVHIETYGCQMNVSDSQVVTAVLEQSGFVTSNVLESDADVILLNTCAIRESAEQKIWHRIDELNSMRKTRKLTVGILGCMAERLKTSLLDSRKVDLVVGPDAYRSLPHLLYVVGEGNERERQAINTQLSIDETYADIMPVRQSDDKVSAFVTVMRGCNNMCSFCIVPHTRGRERSRAMTSILGEVEELSKNGFKEVVLLGQNVNVYSDPAWKAPFNNTNHSSSGNHRTNNGIESILTPGFGSMVKIAPVEDGATFVDLMRAVSAVDKEMRLRFTSPHPKAFPEHVLQLIAETPNICKNLHIPAQSGSTSVLDRMRRNYTREAYLDLIGRVRKVIPNVTISTDMISGFCGETEEEHAETLDLLRAVEFDFAFMFAYSMREKTHAHRTMQDDVPNDVKQRRLSEVIETVHSLAAKKNRNYVGTHHLVLIEGTSKRSSSELSGRSDSNHRVVVTDVPSDLQTGQYCVVKIESTSAITLKGKFVEKSSIERFAKQ